MSRVDGHDSGKNGMKMGMGLESKTGKKAERRTDKKVERRTDKKAESMAGKKAEWRTGKKAEELTGKKAEWRTGKRTEEITGKKTERRTEEKAESMAGKKAEWRTGKKAEELTGKKAERRTEKKAESMSGKKAGWRTGKKTEEITEKKAEQRYKKKAEITATRGDCRKDNGKKWGKKVESGDKKPQRETFHKDDCRNRNQQRDEVSGYGGSKRNDGIGSGRGSDRGNRGSGSSNLMRDEHMVNSRSSDRKMTIRRMTDQRMSDKRAHNRSGLCPVMKECGGCQLLDLDYSEQLKRKQKKVEELFKDICPVMPIIGMKNPFHYRNKVHAVFDRDNRGNIISGIYQENSHDVVPVERCMIEDEKADEIIGSIRGMLKSFKIRTYDEDTGFGLLRHVLIRRAFATNEIMVVLVTASPVFPSKNNFVKALREKHPEITTIVQNINGRGTSMVLGKNENVLYGKGYIVDELCGCRFRISPKSFYQINPVQTEVLYGKAMGLAGLTGKEVVVDAYCGIGTIGIIASKQAGQVIGVELNQDAVRDAVSNAKMNGIQNIRFYCNDAGRFLVNMAERGEKADVVIMDPPRSGSTEEFMDSIGKLGVGKVVYVSCSPETLARDVRYMKKLGYRAEMVWGVDMFPGTNHVESVVLMSRKDK